MSLPKMTDLYLLKDKGDKAILTEVDCVEKCVLYQKDDHKHYVTYADICNAVTQRLYDYDFYFNNLVAGPPNSPQYTEALGKLTDIFSPNLTKFEIQENGVILFTGTSRDEAIGFFTTVASLFFQGYTAHSSLNVRVRPILDSYSCQASTQSQLTQFANFGVLVADAGVYNLTWAYENGVWRIKTYVFNDRLTYVLPDVTLSPTQNAPDADVSKTCQ